MSYAAYKFSARALSVLEKALLTWNKYCHADDLYLPYKWASSFDNCCLSWWITLQFQKHTAIKYSRDHVACYWKNCYQFLFFWLFCELLVPALDHLWLMCWISAYQVLWFWVGWLHLIVLLPNFVCKLEKASRLDQRLLLFLWWQYRV